MAIYKPKLELTWLGKENKPRVDLRNNSNSPGVSGCCFPPGRCCLTRTRDAP